MHRHHLQNEMARTIIRQDRDARQAEQALESTPKPVGQVAPVRGPLTEIEKYKGFIATHESAVLYHTNLGNKKAAGQARRDLAYFQRQLVALEGTHDNN